VTIIILYISNIPIGIGLGFLDNYIESNNNYVHIIIIHQPNTKTKNIFILKNYIISVLIIYYIIL